MTRLNWHDPIKRSFETGLDRGVLYPKNSPAVVWNGLTSVDEVGAEESKGYYIDGRPFAFVPSPKEFKATIKAFTYPDEFSSIMGIAEATDGLYVDSQMGDSFDLCYRTLIGSAAEGTEHGYKIHLVYNATVAPGGITYDTIGSSVNPIDFTWDINAVPVPLPGYRPSAHFMIDTRHLDKDQIKAVENLLYGSESTTVTALPRPSVLFDLLNFGNTVVVTDNGDGTWTAVGSYKDIRVDADGNFEIDNVTATHFPDGHYVFAEVEVPEAPSELDGGAPDSPSTIVYDGGLADEENDLIYDGGSP